MGYQSIDQMSRNARIVWAALTIGLGLLAVVTATANTQSGRIAIALGGGAFVFADLSIATYSKRDPRAYHWIISLALGCMLGILVWLTFGAGDRTCGFQIPFWEQNMPCRIIAGISAMVLGLILSLAVEQALRARRAAV